MPRLLQLRGLVSRRDGRPSASGSPLNLAGQKISLSLAGQPLHPCDHADSDEQDAGGEQGRPG